MNITVLEASEYFRGLLILIRKDFKTTQHEIDVVKRIGKILGFAEEFCANAVSEILENPFITEESPLFSTRELAIKFLRDGISIAFADGEAHPREEEWLGSVARKNGVDPVILLEELKKPQGAPGAPLEAEDLVVRYS